MPIRASPLSSPARRRRWRIASPDDARALADRIPGAGFHLLRACRHLSPLERPGEVTAVLRQWLRA